MAAQHRGATKYHAYVFAIVEGKSMRLTKQFAQGGTKPAYAKTGLSRACAQSGSKAWELPNTSKEDCRMQSTY
jgi:hypothetical protein